MGENERQVLYLQLSSSVFVNVVFMMKDGRVKVGDLGLSKILKSSRVMARTYIGTPYYMSPEIFQKKTYNHKVRLK